MKKTNIKQVMLVLLPALAVFVAALPSSVQIFPLTSDHAEGTIPFSCSYFVLIEGVTGAFTLPFAGFCAGITLMLAVIWLVNKKPGLMTGIKLVAMAGSILAVVPILVKGTEIMIVPNVLVPIALLAEYMIAYSVSKQDKASDKAVIGRRLS